VIRLFGIKPKLHDYLPKRTSFSSISFSACFVPLVDIQAYCAMIMMAVKMTALNLMGFMV
jgi:hypothetical protein